MGSVFYRDPGHNYPVAVRGEGVYLYDANGKEYLDGSGGAAITCLGYCHPEVSKANAVQSGLPMQTAWALDCLIHAVPLPTMKVDPGTPESVTTYRNRFLTR
ncbi:MAG: aminotransferase class III-fold pyridoxal phosphate-dependent enzyme [Proteobacteria bacterium]|nr:aminotransferase class III-fold pyridoxal phosphate-dependent enzyme [Pseudomonadota bacterium]